MLSEFLDRTASVSMADWRDAMPGIRVCRFSMSRSGEDLPVVSSPQQHEALFCLSGTLLLRQNHGGLLTVSGREVLLLSSCTDLSRAQIAAPLTGILVSVDPRKASESREILCGLLGDLNLQTRRVQELMDAQDGCVLLRAAPWSRAVFSALDAMPTSEQGMYCTLKCMEVLYLLCTDSPLLAEEPSPASSPDSYLSRTVTDMRAYMESHLDEKLTIDTMSRQFQISPTAFKSCFRRLYGQPVHHWLQTQRMRRAAELLRTTPLAVLQIAQAVGYEGSSQFNVIFKRQFGVTPRQYKKMSNSVEI